MRSSSSPVQFLRSLASSDIETGVTGLEFEVRRAMVWDQGRICFRTIRRIQRALRSTSSDPSNILRRSLHLLSLCSKFDEGADQQHRATRDTIYLSWEPSSNSPLSVAVRYPGLS